jgi:signal transduction histidine kinase/ActR/RegA family two-component response regulator
MLRRGEKVNIVVDSVLPFGVFCHVSNDGMRGYIRRRELTLQGTLNPLDVVHPGDTLDVVVSELPIEGRLVEFSRRRALPDPWLEFGQKARPWDVVRGAVKFVKTDRVVIEIQPGVDGVIALADLSTSPINRPEEVVWPGDHLEAAILRINPAAHRLQLSIRHHLERLSLINQLLGQMKEQEPSPSLPQVDLISDLPESRPALNYTGRILVAEDDPEVRKALTQWLESAGCQVTACSNGGEALEQFEQQAYSLVFTDINMPLLDGVSLVRQVRQKSPNTSCVLISDPEHISQYFSEIEMLGGYVITKPLDTDEIYQFLEGQSSGALPSPADPLASVGDSPLRPLDEKVASMSSASPLSDRIEAALGHLLEATGAEKVVLFHYDPISHLVSIVVQVGLLPLDESRLNDLVASPVEDVITEEIVIWENRVLANAGERFENLLRLLSFQACIGLPVNTANGCSHALFVFNRQPDVFNRYRVRDVQAAASLISVALEEELFRSYMRNSSTLILNGQLSSAFNHEIYNKVSVLDFQLDMLASAYKNLQDACPQLRSSPQAEQFNKSLLEVTQAVHAINRMAEDFRQITRSGAGQPIAVNHVILQVCEQVRPAASRAGVLIQQDLDAALPDLRLNRFALISVIYNLFINAIQHLENRPGERRVKIQTSRSQVNAPARIHIRVEDNGPGIHCQLWEKIFELGYTTRQGGSGLGLYLARSLVETFGGKIFVEESLVNTGTIFRIEIPQEAATS